MKGLKTVLTAIFIMAATIPSFAQFSSGGGYESSTNHSEDLDMYNIFLVSYNRETWKVDYGKDQSDDLSTNGVSLQYIHGMGVSSKYPLFIDLGIRASIGFYSYSDDDYDDYYYNDNDSKLTTLNLTVPFSLAYQISTGESSYITPYAGLHMKGNIIANEDDEYVLFDPAYDLFEYYDLKRFQFGWQIGLRLSFDSVHLCFEYGSDFTEISKKCKTSNFIASLGFSF